MSRTKPNKEKAISRSDKLRDELREVVGGFVLISYGTAPYVAYAWTVDQLLAPASAHETTQRVLSCARAC